MEHIAVAIPAREAQYRIVARTERFDPDVPDDAMVHYTLKDQDGNLTEVIYTKVDAVSLLKLANTANFSVKSQHRRALEKFVADGKLIGEIGGAPEE